MSDKYKGLLHSLYIIIIGILGIIFFTEYRLFFSLVTGCSVVLTIIEFIFNKPYAPVGSFHNSNAPEDAEQGADAINKFIDEICGYASDRQIRPMLVNNGSEGMILQDMTDDGLTPVKICPITIPPENCKYGSDEYKAAINLITEKIDEYVEHRGKKND